MRKTVLEQTHEQRQRTGMLVALANTGKHVYQGTVPAAVKAARRRKSKAARAARRVHRGSR